jgi:hypothetical protein
VWQNDFARGFCGFLQNPRKQQNLCKSALNCESVGECCELAIGCNRFPVRGYVRFRWIGLALRQRIPRFGFENRSEEKKPLISSDW